MNASLPIGVFDSGLGGLTVLRELTRVLPHENFIYLGDVARLPYGTKSPSVVTRYARHCLEFLQARGVKLIVIACNTATAAALETLRNEISVELFGVIKNGVKAAAFATRNRRVLVLGTRATVISESYPQEFHRQAPDIHVEQVACPLLVPLAEEGWFDNEVSAQIIESYLQSRNRAEADVVLLGCTHYPLLEASFRRVLPPSTALVHSGPLLAEEIRVRLQTLGIENPERRPGRVHLCATDHVSSALPIVSASLGHSAHFELVDL